MRAVFDGEIKQRYQVTNANIPVSIKAAYSGSSDCPILLILLIKTCY